MNGPQKILPKWKLNLEDLRLFSTCLAGGLLLAVMTGPEGDLSTPLYTVDHALFSTHVIGFVIFGVALGAFMVYNKKVRSGILNASWRNWIKAIPTNVKSFILSSGLIQKIIIGVVALVAALLIADFTGPNVPNKMS